MNLEFIKKNYHITTFILLYFSIILGFIFDENTTLGPKFDFFNALKQLALFEESFKFTFLNYDKIEAPTRISPIFILIIFYLKNFCQFGYCKIYFIKYYSFKSGYIL